MLQANRKAVNNSPYFRNSYAESEKGNHRIFVSIALLKDKADTANTKWFH